MAADVLDNYCFMMLVNSSTCNLLRTFILFSLVQDQSVTFLVQSRLDEESIHFCVKNIVSSLKERNESCYYSFLKVSVIEFEYRY